MIFGVPSSSRTEDEELHRDSYPRGACPAGSTHLERQEFSPAGSDGLILLGCDEGELQNQRSKNEELSRVLNISMRKIDRAKERVVTEGLEAALSGRKRGRIYLKRADSEFEAHLIALSCSEPPEGYSRWTLRLLADMVVELEYIDEISTRRFGRS